MIGSHIYDMSHNPEVLFYGEQNTEEECLCEDHGCRMSYHETMGMICYECIRDRRHAEIEEMREEYERDAATAEAMTDEMMSGKCTFIQTKQYNAFNCVMPWWA